ncbi:hypothetical protein D3C87_1555000 [compost metagenome]
MWGDDAEKSQRTDSRDGSGAEDHRKNNDERARMPDRFAKRHGHFIAEIENGERSADEKNTQKTCTEEGCKNEDGRPACLKQRTRHPVRQGQRGFGRRIEQKHR